MSDELKPVCCGCGGEARIVYIDGEDSEDTFVECTKCRISIPVCATEEEAVEDWNRAMGERTAKVMSDGINYCENCEGYVEAPMAYCPYCGARLEWE